MARKNGPTIWQEELYPPSDQPVREELDDARLLDLDVEQESPFLRGQKRVSVRRGALPRKTTARLLWAAIASFVFLFAAMAAAALYHYGERSWRFRVESGDNIEIIGSKNVTRPQVMEVMGGDIGRNIFFVPLEQRQRQLEQIPWVESASVMRFVPNRLRVEVHERTPVAFARVGARIFLVDSGGTLMELPGNRKYSFPVILGMNSGEPLSTRGARMKIYNEVVRQLDSGGAHYSQDLSEVDLSDPDDVKVLASNSQGAVLVHLGSSNYLDRYKIYVGHLQEWRQQFNQLESVDLRYDRQIVVNPDLHGAVKPPPLSFAAAKAALSAGVKPAALITHERSVSKLSTAPAPPHPQQKPAARKKVARTARYKKPKAKARPVLAAQSTTAKTTATPNQTPSHVGSAEKTSSKPSPAILRDKDKPHP